MLLNSVNNSNRRNNMDPIKYIDSVQQGILINMEENPPCVDFDILTQLKETVNNLSKIRVDQLATVAHVKQILKETPYECREFFAHWLLEALDRNDSFCYAFTYLAQETNRIAEEVMVKIKLCDKKEIERLVLEEDEQHGQNSPFTGFDFSERGALPMEVVVKVFNLLTREKIISGEESDFIAMFSEGLEVEAPIKWLLINQKKEGLQNDLFFFLDIMFGGLPREVKRRAVNLFVDKNGKHFVKSNSGIIRKGAVIKEHKIENELREILKIP